jgi:phosphopantetheinyl transferase
VGLLEQYFESGLIQSHSLCNRRGCRLQIYTVNLHAMPVGEAEHPKWCIKGSAPGHGKNSGNSPDAHGRQASGLFLSLSLKHFTGDTLAGSSVVRDPHGKPRLLPELCFFNPSHCPPFAAIGITESSDIGIDVETRITLSGAMEVADQVLSPKELSEWNALNRDARCGRFLAYWRVKEAILKAFGEGLQRNPREICIEFTHEGPRIRRLPSQYGDPCEWEVGEFKPPDPFPVVAWALAP